MTGRPRVVVHRDKTLLAEASAARLAVAVLDAQAARGGADIVLTGGSMGSAILEALGRSPLREAVDWSTVNVWWGDERFLPTGDPDRNETQAREALLDAMPLDPARVHPMAGPDTCGSPEESAEQYAAALAQGSGAPGDVPAFDVVMLGVGPDAHIASLFPGHEALRATGSTVGVHGSPKPPPERVSLTFEALQRGTQVWFLVAGADKAEAVRRALGGASREEAPAGSVHGTSATVWLLDADAAGELPGR
ncbi:6-phosphogluconolactonase [Lapillicoccus sp.]|uniref:6-phosphogluconolactonase n=1 Tax=Lapillicoccus sp. TaxID=1909287 RepID=UPI0039837F19